MADGQEEGYGSEPEDEGPPPMEYDVTFTYTVTVEPKIMACRRIPKPPPKPEGEESEEEDSEEEEEEEKKEPELEPLPPTATVDISGEFFGQEPLAGEGLEAATILGGSNLQWTEEQKVHVDEAYVRAYAEAKGFSQLTFKLTALNEPEPEAPPPPEEGEEEGPPPKERGLVTFDMDMVGLLVGDTEWSYTWRPGATAEIVDDGMDHWDIPGVTDGAGLGLQDYYESVTVTVTVDKPMVPKGLALKINPVVITPLRCVDLPDQPATQEQLDTKCHPLTLQYTFFGHDQPFVHSGDISPWSTVSGNGAAIGNEIATRSVQFGQHDIFFAGEQDPAELFKAVDKGFIDFKVYDRTALPEEEVVLYVPRAKEGEAAPEAPAEEGEEKPEEKEVEPMCYGQAKVSLHPLTAGKTNLKIRANITPVSHHKGGKGLDWKTRPGRYMETGASLALHVRAATAIQEPPEELPFMRCVFVLEYRDSNIYNDIAGILRDANATALDCKGTDQHILTTLTTYKLDEEQMTSHELDIITGFHLVDDKRRLIVVEGLANGSMRAVQELAVEALTENPENGVKRTVLLNDKLLYPTRLYAGLGADLWPIKLCKPLTKLVAEAANMAGSRVRPVCMEALKRLSKLAEVKWHREVERMDLLPTYEMLSALDKKFGGELTLEDLEGTPEHQPSDNDLALMEAMEKTDDESKKNMMKSMTRIRMLVKPQVDRDNAEYLEVLNMTRKQRREKDWIADNKSAIPVLYDSQGAAKKAALHSWNPHKTRARPTQELLETMRTQRRRDIAALDASAVHGTTWQWPCPKSAAEYIYLDKPADSRIAELKEPWVEDGWTGLFNPEKPGDAALFPTIFADKNGDGTIEENPKEYFKSVHLTGAALEAEQRAAEDKFMEEWKGKVVVDELTFKSVLPIRKKPSQTDRNDLILKDPAKKKGISGRSSQQPMPQSIFHVDPMPTGPVHRMFHPESYHHSAMHGHDVMVTDPPESEGTHLRPKNTDKFLTTKLRTKEQIEEGVEGADFKRFIAYDSSGNHLVTKRLHREELAPIHPRVPTPPQANTRLPAIKPPSPKLSRS